MPRLFVEKLIAGDNDASVRSGLDAFLASLPSLENPVEFDMGSRELPTGLQSRFVDIYPVGLVKKHDSFGGFFVRVWAVGNPIRLIYGLFLGAERAQQAEPRRAAQFIRKKLHSVIDPLERASGFSYRTWGDADIEWTPAGQSARAVTRQLEQFVSFKRASGDQGLVAAIEGDLREAILTLDQAVALLQPIRDFGMDVLELYFGQNLPPKAADALTTAASPAPEPASQPSANLDWEAARDAQVLGGLLGVEGPYQQALAALEAGKHVVFFGPPGVGKTELAEQVCRALAVPYDTATATSDWSTFDTIGGYLPAPSLDGGVVTEPLDFSFGLVTEALRGDRWLVLDELNRADIDKAFGEMFTLLGGGNKSIRLPFRKRQADGSYKRVSLGATSASTPNDMVIGIPSSWRLIGTMNTADKASLYQLSFAFMRRFAFVFVDTPPHEDYAALIERASASLITYNDDSFAEFISSSLKRLFASDSDKSLRSIGIPIGPALPLDIIRYVEQRAPSASPAECLIEGLEMFLFPQFEGRNEKFLEILDCLRAVSGGELPLTTVSSLALWTGYDDI